MMNVNKYLKKNKLKVIKMNNRMDLMNCLTGIKKLGKYDELKCDRNRNWFGVITNGYLTYYYIEV